MSLLRSLTAPPTYPPPSSKEEKEKAKKEKHTESKGLSKLNKILGGLLCLSLWRKGPLCCSASCSCFNDVEVESPEAERLRRETARHRATEAKWMYRTEKAANAEERRKRAEEVHAEKVRRHGEFKTQKREERRMNRRKKKEGRREGKRKGEKRREEGEEGEMREVGGGGRDSVNRDDDNEMETTPAKASAEPSAMGDAKGQCR